jgi:putative DNA primase/helicase
MLMQDGNGENGKTTLAEGIRGAIGDYFTLISRRALLGNPDNPSPERMSFRGTRYAVLEELPEAHRLNVTSLKDTVGMPTMKARYLYQNEVEFRSTHSLFLNTNYLPVVDETDWGTWRRLARLQFPYKFVRPPAIPTEPHEKPGDPNLRDRIEAGKAGQWEAALAWLVAGAIRWYEADRILPPHPERVEADTREWRGKSDLLLAYADERLVIHREAHVMATDLLADFDSWLEDRNQKPWGDRLFTARLEQHSAFNVQKRRIRATDRLSRREGYVATAPPARYMAWHGVRFRTASDDEGETSSPE